MRIIVSDSSCLIDLRKVSLLGALLRLPCEFLIPDTLFEDEQRNFTPAEKQSLLRAGLQVIELPGERVLRAQAVMRSRQRLSVYDGFAFVLAEQHPGSSLLAGDGELRSLAMLHQMRVHGVLWVIDELHRNNILKAKALLEALKTLSADPAVKVAGKEISASIKRFTNMKQ